jgi:RNA polymerase sigma-B factor
MEASVSPHAAVAGLSMAQLFDRWCRRRDRAARTELIRRHLPLARRLASRYGRSGEPIDDLVQVASVGLINAVERFDPDHGAAFSSFAVPTILGELKRHFRDTGWAVRVDRRTQERATAVRAAERELSATGREPTVATLAGHLECAEDEVRDALEASGARSTVSLDAPMSAPAGAEPDSTALVDLVGSDDPDVESIPDRAALSSAVRHLPRLERTILYLRYAGDLSQREISSQVGISQMHVSRLLRRSLGELRELVDDDLADAA